MSEIKFKNIERAMKYLLFFLSGIFVCRRSASRLADGRKCHARHSNNKKERRDFRYFEPRQSFGRIF